MKLTLLPLEASAGPSSLLAAASRRPLYALVPMSELNLVLLGPPGSGKGTQGERLQQDFRLPYYATGTLSARQFGTRRRSADPPRSTWYRGDLVPDDVIVGVIAERLDQAEAADGFILDGFPRTTAQAEALDARVSELGRSLTPQSLLVDVSDEEVVRRLGGRRTCVKEGHVFHVEFDPPQVEGVCDICGAELIVRDDKPDVIRHRLATYHEKTEPLVAYYEQHGDPPAR